MERRSRARLEPMLPMLAPLVRSSLPHPRPSPSPTRASHSSVCCNKPCAMFRSTHSRYCIPSLPSSRTRAAHTVRPYVTRPSDDHSAADESYRVASRSLNTEGTLRELRQLFLQRVSVSYTISSARLRQRVNHRPPDSTDMHTPRPHRSGSASRPSPTGAPATQSRSYGE